MNLVYTIDDLSSRVRLDAGHHKPARLAVIGQPISHSASPRMHQPALDAAGIDARYIRLEVEPGRVGEAFERMRALGFIGCNVTVPHKLEAMEHCGVSDQARALGAVNTVCFDREKNRGYNTDGPGFMNAIADDFGVQLGTLSVAVVGAGGGAGQAIATQCAMLGVARLVVVNRSLAKLGPLVERLRTHGPETEIVALSFDDPALREYCLSCDLIVNTSSLGLKTSDASILPKECLKREHLVYDTIYQPPVTSLLAAADEVGCRTANGRSMLVHQGALAFQHWFPGTDPLLVMRGALPGDD